MVDLFFFFLGIVAGLLFSASVAVLDVSLT